MRGQTQSSSMTPVPLGETRTVGHLLPQVLIDVTAGLVAFPVGTLPLGPHVYSWVEWSNARKGSCPRKQQHKVELDWQADGLTIWLCWLPKQSKIRQSLQLPLRDKQRGAYKQNQSLQLQPSSHTQMVEGFISVFFSADQELYFPPPCFCL